MSFTIYRCESDSKAGGTKDWAIQIQSDKLLIKYGSTDKVNRTQEIPLSKCVNGSTSDEASKRITSKTKKGYEYHGEGDFKNGKIITPIKKEDKRLFWSINTTSMTEQDYDALYQQALMNAKAIRDSTDQGHVLESPNSFEIRKDGTTFLSFGITDDEIQTNRISKNHHKGHGHTTEDKLPEYQIVFYLALAKQFSEFALANHEGNIIEPVFNKCPLLPNVKSDEFIQLAEELNLLPKSICYQQMSQASGGWFY